MNIATFSSLLDTLVGRYVSATTACRLLIVNGHGGNRSVLEALAYELQQTSIFYVLRSGCQWRMLPRDLMPWDAAHRRFMKWSRDGTWDRVHDELRRRVRIEAGRDLEPSAAVIDAQSIKSSEGGEARGFDAGKRTTGRKRHVIVDTMGLLLVVAVTSASVQDRAGGRAVLARLAAGFRTVSLVWADGGYANSVDSTLLSWARDALNIVVEIVKRTQGCCKVGFQG